MTTQEKRFLRRNLINFYLQQNKHKNKFTYFHYNIKRVVRDMEVYHYGTTLAVYSQYVTYTD